MCCVYRFVLNAGAAVQKSIHLYKKNKKTPRRAFSRVCWWGNYISSSSLPFVSLMNFATKKMLKMAKNE